MRSGVDKSVLQWYNGCRSSRLVEKDVHIVGRINVEIYKCVTDDITTDEVIITDERIRHITEHHPEDYEFIKPFFQEILAAPDYILEDSGRAHTGLVLKELVTEKSRVQVVLRLHTSLDDPSFKNSIISAWRISESRWNNYINNKKTLYKAE